MMMSGFEYGPFIISTRGVMDIGALQPNCAMRAL